MAKTMVKKIKNILKKALMTLFKIIVAPINFIALIFFKRKSKNKINYDALEDLAIKFYESYGEKIMFKLELGTNGENLTIYSSNFKTTLEKPKKRQKDIIEVEANERS